MNDPHQTAVVILNWNGKHYLESFLPGVWAHTHAHARVVVADNGSEDGSADFVREHFPGVSLILLDRNYGFAEGYNQALKQIEATYYVLLNSDVETSPGWLSPLEEMMEQHPDAAACAPKIRSLHHKDQFEYAGAAGGFMDHLGYVFCRGRIFHTCEKDTGQYDQPGEIFWASGACMMIRAQAFHEAGGFDAFFFAHMEEIDLCWRLRNRGHRVLFQPNSVVYHLGGGTLPVTSPRKTMLNYRNNLLMMYRNLPRKQAPWILTARMFLDGVSGVAFLLAGNPVIIRSVWLAHMAFYKALCTHYDKKSLRSQRPEAFPAGLLHGSVVFQFFVLHRRHFSRLRF